MQSAYSPHHSVLSSSPSRGSTSTRPPIHNPYDKFTRPQFDEWIGDITSALRQALGRDEEDGLSVGRRDMTKHVVASKFTTPDEEDSSAEDSFVDLKARREKVLGKMKAIEPYSDYESSQEDEGGVEQIHESGSSPENAIDLLSKGDEEDGYPGDDDAADEASVRDMILRTSPGPSKIINSPHVHDEDRDVSEPLTDEEGRDFLTRTISSALFSRLSPCSDSDAEQPPDIRDPWELPKFYAEDLYTGGDVHTSRKVELSPSHLTPDDESVIDIACAPNDDLFGTLLQDDSTDGKLTFSNGSEGRMDQESAPGPDTSRIGERLGERLFSTPSGRQSSPVFALNDQVDWNTPKFEERSFQSAMIQGEGESGSEASSNEDDEIAVSDEDFDERSPIPLGTSDLDIDIGGYDEEPGDLEEESGIVPNHRSYGDRGLAYPVENHILSTQESDRVTNDGQVSAHGDVTNVATLHDHMENGTIIGDLGISGVRSSEDVLVMHGESTPSSANIFPDAASQAHGTLDDTGFIFGASEHEQDAVARVPNSPPPKSATPDAEKEVVREERSLGKQTTISIVDSFLAEGLVESWVKEGYREFPLEDSHQAATSGDGFVVQSPRIHPAYEQTNSPEIESQIYAADSKESETADVNSQALPTLNSDPGKSDASLVKDPVIEEKKTEIETRVSIPEETPDLGRDVVHSVSQILTEESQPVVIDKESKGSAKPPYDFIMPIIANPNVRDPTSLPHTSVPSASSQPDTPQSNVSSLPVVVTAISNFMRDNDLSTDTAHGSSGLFTPLEGEDVTVPSPIASDNSDRDVEGKDSHLVPDVAPGPIELEDSIDGARASTPTGSEAPGLATQSSDVGVEHGKETGEQAQDNETIPSDNDRPSVSPSSRAVKLDAPLPNPQPTEIEPTTCDDTSDMELAYPSMPIVSDDHEGANMKADYSHNQNMESALGVGDVGGVYSDECSLQPSVSGLHNETDHIKGDYVDEDMHLHKSRVTSKEANGDSASSPKAKIEPKDPSDLMGDVASAGSERVNTTENFSSVISEGETTESKKSVERETTEGGPKSEEALAEVQARNRSTDQFSTRKAYSVSPDRPKPPKRKRSPSGSSSSALTRSVSQGKLRTYGKSSRDKSEEAPVENHKLQAGSKAESRVIPTIKLRPLKHVSRTSDPRVSSNDQDLPMLHGHGKSKKNKANQLRRQLQQLSQDALATKLKTAESPQDVKSPKKPSRSLDTSVPSQQSDFTASSSSTSPTSPLSSAAPAESGLAHQSSPSKSDPPPSSPSAPFAPKTTPSPRQAVVPKSISTRSHCRYRTISLPRGENGPRVKFCVPQCSLNDTELMKMEQITDDGHATQRDYDKLIEHVDSLDFDPRLLGVLKLLVGVDLFRENEIYYLPQEGEVVMRKTTKGTLHKATKDSPDKKSVPDSPQSSSVAGPASNSAAPPSYAESISTSWSSLRQESNQSITDIEDSDGSYASPTKRPKRTHQTEAGDHGSATSTTSPTRVRKSHSRVLRKRLSRDAQNYDPEVEQEDTDQSNEEDVSKPRQKKSTQRRLKRRRTESDTARHDSGSSLLIGSGSKSKRAKVIHKDTLDDI